MSLSAKNKNGDVVYSIGLAVKDQRNKYYCRGCGARMSLKLPYNKVEHFAHYPGHSPCNYGVGETEEHLAAKKFFYNKYVNDPTYEKVELESEMDGGERRGDVVLYPADHNIKPTVIEVQKSTIPKLEIQDRFHDWNRCGYSMMWVVIPSSNKVPGWVHYIKDIYFGVLYVYKDDAIHIVYRGKCEDVSDFCITPGLNSSDNYMLSMIGSDVICDINEKNIVKESEKKHEIVDFSDKKAIDKMIADHRRSIIPPIVENHSRSSMTPSLHDLCNYKPKKKYLGRFTDSRCIGIPKNDAYWDDIQKDIRAKYIDEKIRELCKKNGTSYIEEVDKLEKLARYSQACNEVVIKSEYEMELYKEMMEYISSDDFDIFNIPQDRSIDEQVLFMHKQKERKEKRRKDKMIRMKDIAFMKKRMVNDIVTAHE